MWHVKTLSDRDEILAFLQRDRLYAAYAIGDLEPGLFEQCEWFAARMRERITALCLLFRGLEPPALLTFGEKDGLAAILGQALGPPRAHFVARLEHQEAIEATYVLGEIHRMVRMVVAPADFCPVPGPTAKLDLSHLAALRQLYRLGGGEAFAPYQLRDGVYYGVEADGRLISVAGTHLVSPTYGVAAVGNVFTHPDYRNRGYATACTSAVTQELLAHGLDVVLNVHERNAPAIRAYEKLGYRPYCSFIEAPGERKHVSRRT